MELLLGSLFRCSDDTAQLRYGEGKRPINQPSPRGSCKARGGDIPDDKRAGRSHCQIPARHEIPGSSYVRMVRDNNVQLDDKMREQLAVIEEKCQQLGARIRQAQRYTAENPLLTLRRLVELCAFLKDFYRFNQPDVEVDG